MSVDHQHHIWCIVGTADALSTLVTTLIKWKREWEDGGPEVSVFLLPLAAPPRQVVLRVFHSPKKARHPEGQRV